MRKPPFCTRKSNGVDQLGGYRAADQRLRLRYIDIQSLCFLNPKSQALAVAETARYVSDLVGNPEDRRTRNPVPD